MTLVMVAPALAGERVRTYDPSDAERARWTMADMRSIAIALESYRQDHGSYPGAASLEDLRGVLAPYIRVLPVRDAWGNAFRLISDGGEGYQITSAGSDHRFDEATWAIAGEQQDFAADAVLRAGMKFVRPWQYR